MPPDRRMPLSRRELECLHWSALGKTSWETAIILGLSERTVNFHVRNACHKLRVHSRRAAIALALGCGMIKGISAKGVSAPAAANARTPARARPAAPVPGPLQRLR